MGIGKQTDNHKFYDGYEDEPEIVFSTETEKLETLHIWDGFFDDIFREPSLDGKGWNGFTRDYHQCEGAFGEEGEMVILNIQEYIDDLNVYKNRNFDYEETENVYRLICSWLKRAIECGCESVTVRVI